MNADTTSWSDPALVTGQSYYDANAGVTFTAAWVNSTNAGVKISFASQQCVKSAPGMAISPSQSQWGAPGSTMAYTITVTNNDNAACAPSTFNLQAAGPSGWTATFATTALTIAPGASASATLNVTSPSSATDGYYTINVAATDASDASRSVTSSVTYVVVRGSSGTATLTLTYNGKVRDRVGQNNLALAADGALDGVLTATLSASGGRTVTGLQLQSTGPGTWDTDGSNWYWALGVATTLDGALLNNSTTGAVRPWRTAAASWSSHPITGAWSSFLEPG